MNDWKQINLRDAAGKVVFDDEWGFVRIGSIYYQIEGQNIYELYADVSRGNKKKLSVDVKNTKELTDLFSTTVYYRGNRKSYQHYEYISTTVKEITVCVNASPLKGRSYYHSDPHCYVITEKNKKDLSSLRKVWTCKELQERDLDTEKLLRYPSFNGLKAGQKIIYDGGVHVIKKVYPQPNEQGAMISVKVNGEEKVVLFNEKIYALPYDECGVAETEIFNGDKNEYDLMPFAVSSDYRTYVYWNKIDGAAEYIVSLYRLLKRPYLKSVYHMRDYTAERNDGCLTIDGLDDGDYVITVRAEDRSGEIIALSRGFELRGSGLSGPQFWEYEPAGFGDIGIYFPERSSGEDDLPRLRRPLFKDLKRGGKVTFRDRKYVIRQVYPQPNEENLMISVAASVDSKQYINLTFGEEIRVAADDKEYTSETAIFNESKNEFDLSPFAVYKGRSGNRLHVYWNKIDDAAEYTVSLYRLFKRPYFRNIYHLKDYTVDRSKGFISLDGLEECIYIVTVKAENRKGEQIALSRGILIDCGERYESLRFAQYWRED